MESSTFSSLDVLSKACHYVATQDSLQSDGKISPTKNSENTPLNFTKAAITSNNKDVLGEAQSAKGKLHRSLLESNLLMKYFLLLPNL